MTNDGPSHPGATMSATVLKDSPSEPQQSTAKITSSDITHPTVETERATCECCGLTEECTHAYAARIRERYVGRWICGLCAEAIKDEVLRAGRLIAIDEAITRHVTFCRGARIVSSRDDRKPTLQLIDAVSHLMRRSLASSPRTQSLPNTPRGVEKAPDLPLGRSESCLPNLDA